MIRHSIFLAIVWALVSQTGLAQATRPEHLTHEILVERSRDRLWDAARDGRAQEVRDLLDQGVDPNVPGKRGVSPLYAAAVGEHPEIVKILLAAHAVPDVFAAVALNDLQSLNRLLRDRPALAGAKLDDWTLLHCAAEQGSADAIAVILDAGARLDAKTNLGWTPLHSAAFMGNAPAVRALIARGAELEEPTENGERALHLGASRGGDAVVRLLLEAGADLVARTQAGEKPVDYAVTQGNDAALRILMEADVDWTLNKLLIRAISNWQPGIADLLLRRGADPNALTSDGTPVLHLAVSRRSVALVRVLLSHGADPGTRDRRQRNATEAGGSDIDKDVLHLLREAEEGVQTRRRGPERARQ